ncbi:unnamed protein product [Symbiodinium necroappetens]|uniref:Uncharacterized protein n=1 Tax=Symbiodinium necroappetens TaxID=1628268 RepID=A0A813BLD9_9DINO|nr:unnamed protein product [Symbiodinium microadriaticum]CAE7681167.1 unnamed protein product [Symbiodinium sp. KB8]CAE7906569.1 unnamed protein product [Symbiodinium necroappetens]
MHSDGGQRGLCGCQRGYSTCRRDRWKLRSFACCACAVVVSSSWIALDKLAWCFGGGGMASRNYARAHLQQRQLFGGFLDPSDWQRDSFVGEALSLWLPSYPPKTEVVALEVEPSSDRYWSYLKPEKCKWYMDKIVAVGEKVGDLEERTLMFMKATANDMGADFQALTWKKAGVPAEIQLGSIDIGLMSDGTFTELGAKGTEAALRRMFLMLKNSGRFFVIANTDDEQFGFREQLVLGFEPAVLKRVGWQIQAAKRDNGVVVAYLAKRRATGAKKSRRITKR